MGLVTFTTRVNVGNDEYEVKYTIRDPGDMLIPRAREMIGLELGGMEFVGEVWQVKHIILSNGVTKVNLVLTNCSIIDLPNSKINVYALDLDRLKKFFKNDKNPHWSIHSRGKRS